MNRILTLSASLGLLLAASTGLAAQDQPAAKLQQLLRELQGLGGKAWDQRCADLEQEAKAQERVAAQHREQAKALEQQAVQATAAAARLRQELERLRALQQALDSLPPPPPAAPVAPATPAAPAAPAKVDAPKAPAPAAAAAPAPAAAPAGPAVTWAQVEPIFSDHCAGCHDADDKKGGLDLTSLPAVLAGGGSGRSVVPGEPDQSRLLRMVAQQERPFMPKDADPLPAAVVATVRRWIEQGAAADAAGVRAFAATRAAAASAPAAATDADAPITSPLPENLPACAVRVPAQKVPLPGLARSPGAPLLAVAGWQQVLLFDTDLHPLGALPCAAHRVAPVAFAETGTLLGIGIGDAGRRGAVAVFDVRTGALTATVGAEADVPLAVAVHAARGLVAFGGAGKHTRLVALSDGKQAFAFRHEDFVLGVAFTVEGSLLAGADRQGHILAWNTATGAEQAHLQGHVGAVTAIAFDRRGRLVSGGADGTVRGWDVDDGKETWRVKPHDGEVAALAIGPRHEIATCGSDGRIAVLDAGGKQLARCNPVGEWLFCVAFGADAETVFAGDAAGQLHRFDRRTKQTQATSPFAGPASSSSATQQ